LTNLQGFDILKLLIAVDEFDIKTLIPCIQEYLIKHQCEFLRQNSVEILKTIYQHGSLTDLWSFYLEKICEEPEILFNSDKFINLNAPLLESILKRDDLKLNEIFIWDSLIKWCLAQNSNISQDVKKWNKEDITIMERTIHRFIPLIRFYHISPQDFISRVFPYKGLLSDDLISDIFTFHMAPNMKPNINIQPLRQSKCVVYDSTLISSQHFAIFSSWIEKKNDSHYNYNTRNIPYEFNLLYRDSRDGNTIQAFHDKCDNKGATIVVVKIENSDQLVGGYNPLLWDSSGRSLSTADSFIFSFKSKNNIQSAKLGYSYDSSTSIQCLSGCGPVFGSNHLYLWKSSFTAQQQWYSNPKSGKYSEIDDMPTGDFYADDYEVFQIIKK
jgi:hypothetical protein